MLLNCSHWNSKLKVELIAISFLIRLWGIKAATSNKIQSLPYSSITLKKLNNNNTAFCLKRRSTQTQALTVVSTQSNIIL
jgi:hypothetical protein